MPTAEDPTVVNLQRARGALAAQAVRRLEEDLPWYRAMAAQDRSWVGLVAHAGVSAFIAWFSEPAGAVKITADVFGLSAAFLIPLTAALLVALLAPRLLAGSRASRPA